MTTSELSMRTFFAKRALPIFMTRSNKYASGLLLWVLAVLLYLPSNHIHFFEPVYLHFGWIDSVVPFLPYTVWIYISEYIFFAAIYIASRDMVNLNKYFYSFLALQTTSVLIFWIWPTTYPRDLFPLTPDIEPITYWVFSNLRQLDTPANCCPSLHVSSVYLSSFIFLDEQKKKFPFFFIWGSLIAFSTLTTKQHYLIDVIVGFGMAVGAYWIFHKIVPYRQLAPRKKNTHHK